MIRVRMGSDDILNRLHTLLCKIILYRSALAVVAGIDQHIFTVAGKQYTVPLPYIQIVDRHFRICRFIGFCPFEIPGLNLFRSTGFSLSVGLCQELI